MVYVYVLLTIMFILFIYELLYERKVRAYANQLSGPGRLFPFVGSAFSFLRPITDIFWDYDEFLQLNNFKCSTMIGPKLYFVLTDPRDVKAIIWNPKLSKKSSEYSFLKPWLGEGLLLSSGEKWRRHRKLITPAFHFNTLKYFVPIIEKNVDVLVEKFTKLTTGESFDIFEYITLCALDITSEATMGVSINAQMNSNSKYLQGVHGMCEILVLRLQHILLRLDVFFNLSFSKRRQNEYLKTLFDFTDSVIRKRKDVIAQHAESCQGGTEAAVKKHIFLDQLLMPDIHGRKLSETSLRDEVNTFMFGAHDTISSAVSFILYCIAEHCDVQEKLFAEQQLIFGDNMDRPIRYDDIQQMNYLGIVIKESLRIYPIAPFLARTVEEDTEINGLKVPKGATVAINIYHMHHRADLFGDPSIFRPERFSSDQENSSRDPYSYLPFSIGPRNCIGQKFAQIEMKMMVSKLMRKFKFHSSGIKPILDIGMILKSKNGINVKLTKRQ